MTMKPNNPPAAGENTTDTSTSTTEGSNTNVTISGLEGAGNLPDEQLAKALADAEEWKKRFAGLQGKYQQEQTKWAEASAKMLDFDTENKRLSGELEALRVEQQKAVEDRDSYLTDLDIKSAELERIGIITREFPHLLPLMGVKEDEDTLPDGTGDELRAKLKVMSEKIESIKKGARDEYSSGQSPENPPAPLNADSGLLKQAIDAMRAGKMDEYNQLYAQYIEKSKSAGG